MLKSKKVLLGLAILLIIGTGLMFWYDHYKSSTVQPEVVYTTTTPKDVDWIASLPSVRAALRSEFLGTRMGEKSPVKIYATGDITGDGISEAIVDMGIEGGYQDSSFMKLMMIENNKPTTTEVRLSNGNYVNDFFFQVGKGSHSEDMILLPAKNIIYQVIRVNAGTFKDCVIVAYQWNPDTKSFDFNQTTSDEIKTEVCK